MKKRIVFFACILITAGYVLADNLHFSGVAFQENQASASFRTPEFGLVLWNSPNSSRDKNVSLICPVNFHVSNAVLQSMTVRYYDNDPKRALRIRLMRLSIDTGLTEVQAEWNSALLGDTGWTKVDSYIYKQNIDNNTYSYWLEALCFETESHASESWLLALQSVRISYATPQQSTSNQNPASGSTK